MKAYCLGSSSAGNCFVLLLDRGEGLGPFPLMVECGLSYRQIVGNATKQGISLSEVKACLITHSHKDHSAAARDLAKRGLTIYATDGTLKAIGVQGWPMHYGKAQLIAEGVKALAFRVRHDAPEPAGFLIKTAKETVLFAIDAKSWIDDLSAIEADYVFIEANYDPKMMAMEQFSLRKKTTIEALHQMRLNDRIAESHMSIDGALATISKLSKKRLKAVFITHLSDRMSAPRLWKQSVQSLTGAPCYAALKQGSFE